MMLSVRDLDPGDVHHLFCSDPHLVEEVAAVNRSLERLDERVSTWTHVDPHTPLNRKEVAA